MDTPISHALLHPLLGTYARFFIGAILNFKPTSALTKTFLHPKGHFINKVEIFGFVTERVEKSDSVKISVDDGTGTIFCFINKAGGTRNLSAQETIGHFIERSVKADFGDNNSFMTYITKPTDVRIGDFVRIQADLISSHWNVFPQLVMRKMTTVKELILETWSKWNEETVSLNEAVYSVPFNCQNVSSVTAGK